MRRLLFTICLCLVATVAWAQEFGDGVEAYENGDYAQAFRIWLPLAERADTAAQYNVGLMYDNGFNVKQDYSTAIKWYRLSAGKGYAPAQNNLGSIHREGRGVPRDHLAAIKWYRQAANQGFSEAQYNLGSLYKSHEDYVSAHMWWNIAASKGHIDAGLNLDVVEKRMTPEDVHNAQRFARICLAKDYKYCN